MKRLLFAVLLVFALAPPVAAADFVLFDYDVDSATFIYPIYCTPALGVGVNLCPGSGWSDGAKITTSGASSTTVTAVDGATDPFGLAAVGDAVTFVPSQTTTTTLRRFTAVASADSATIDTATTIPTAGAAFKLWDLVVGTGAADDGWFRYPGTGDLTLVIDVNQMSATSVDYHVQCRHTYIDRYTAPVYVAGTAATPISVTAAAGQRVTLTDEGFDSCRVGFKVTTDDAGAVISATTDDIDYTEDPLGVPVACRAVVAAATYTTGASLCTAVAAAMNTAGICAGATNPANTYACAFSSTTGKVTISRSAGAKTFDLDWASGPNTATSAKTALGYSNVDDEAALTYTGDTDIATDEAVNTEKIGVTLVRVQ